MSQSSALEAILADLAAGVIDTAEAGRRIEALGAPGQSAANPYDDPGPAREEYASGRPQFATHATERLGRPGEGEDEARPGSPEHPVSPQGAETGTADASEAGHGAQEPPAASPGGGSAVTRLVVRATGRLVKVIGDPTVATAQAQGPHTLRRLGDLLEVTSEGDIGPSLRGFSVINPPRSAEDLRRVGFGEELVVRVNPAIELDAELTGGALTTTRLPRLGRIRVTAGAATLDDVVCVRDALVQAGGASLRGPISQGRSRVRVESGNLTVGLYPRANVAVTAHSQLGLVSWPEGQPKNLDEYVVGDGTARLDLAVVMGHVSVRVEDGPEPPQDDDEPTRQWWQVWRR